MKDKLRILKRQLFQGRGEFIFNLTDKDVYDLYAKKGSFFSQVVEDNANNYDREKSLFVKLEICAEKVECGEAIRLNNILYDLDKYFIREDAKADLNTVVRFMEDNPTAKVELSSHTDSKGGNLYNQTLSQNRAKAAVDYIVSQGVNTSRIIAKGYGETKLLNKCADGVSCSKDEHQLNRHTEFKVICPN